MLSAQNLNAKDATDFFVLNNYETREKHEYRDAPSASELKNADSYLW
jgi:hypothetical protein